MIANVNITDGEWHNIQWARMRNLTSLDYELTVLVDGTIGLSTNMFGDINQLAINGTAYFHIAGLTDFNNIQGKSITTSTIVYCKHFCTYILLLANHTVIYLFIPSHASI